MHISSISDAELRSHAREISENYQHLLFDEQRRKDFTSFYDSLVAADYPNAKDIADKVKSVVEERIIRQIKYLSEIQYAVMEKTGDYTDLGEQRVSISYCRLMLNIPPAREVSQYDADRFRQMIQEKHRPITHLSIEQLQELEKKEKFDICGRSFDTFQDDDLNATLEYLGSAKRMTIGFFGKQRSIIFGDVEIAEMDDYRVYTQNTEDARTPTNCLSIAAIIGEKNITIRRVALETIFYNKWVRVFQTSPNELRRMCSNTEGNIREMLKQNALKVYGVSSEPELITKKDLFVDEMIEGVLWHEVGHGLSMEGIDHDDVALGEAFHTFDDDMVGVLKEFLADCALPAKDLRGPLAHFIDLALKENQPDKATRLIWVYLSDNWFLDVNEDFMADQTDVIVTVLAKFIRPDFSIDFEAFDKGLIEIYELLQVQFLEVVQTVKKLFESTSYNIKSMTYTYPEVKAMLVKIMDEDRDEFTAPTDTLQFQTNYWSNMFGYAKDYAPQMYAELCEYVSKSKHIIKSKFVEYCGGPEAVEQYKGEIRPYLFDRMKTLGVYRSQNQFSILEAIDMAIEDCWVPYGEKDNVRQKFRDIVEGKALEISRQPEAYDPFVTVIQEMLNRSYSTAGNKAMRWGVWCENTLHMIKRVCEDNKPLSSTAHDLEGPPIYNLDKALLQKIVDGYLNSA